MRPKIIHSLAVFLAAIALPFAFVCGCQKGALPDAAEAALYLNIATLEHTRAGGESLLSNEKMHTLRVIVLHEDGTVEHNKHYSLASSEWENKLILLKVQPDEKKKIFLFANEESVSSVEGVDGVTTGSPKTLTEFFASYSEDPNDSEDKNDFEAAVNALYFAPDYSEGKPIPMSSMYEIQMGKGYVDKTFYLVRVATKFTINFENWRGEAVTVNNFSIESHADKNFLMAHVNDTDQNKELFGEGKTWLDWLMAVSDASNKEDYVTSDEDWLKDYDLPGAAATKKTYTHGQVSIPAMITANPTAVPGEASTIFYLPESRNLKADATSGEQEYTLTLNIDEVSEPFVRKLPNLKALFRNTHVVINIAMYNNLEITVEVQPWENRNLYLDYTETVVSDGPISWEEGTFDAFDEANNVIVLKPWTYSKDGDNDATDLVWVPLTGSFTFTNPVGAKWTASILTIEGDPVFRFLTHQGEAVPNISDTIGGYYDDNGNYINFSSALSIVSLESDPQHKNRAKLHIVVTLPNGTVLPSGFEEYTIVQNPL